MILQPNYMMPKWCSYNFHWDCNNNTFPALIITISQPILTSHVWTKHICARTNKHNYINKKSILCLYQRPLDFFLFKFHKIIKLQNNDKNKLKIILYVRLLLILSKNNIKIYLRTQVGAIKGEIYGEIVPSILFN